MDIYWWLERTGRLARTIDEVPDRGAARRSRRCSWSAPRATEPTSTWAPSQRAGSGSPGGWRASDGARPRFADDLADDHGATPTAGCAASSTDIDARRAEPGSTASCCPPAALAPVPRPDRAEPLDLRADGIGTVVLATGYRPQLPVAARCPVLAARRLDPAAPRRHSRPRSVRRRPAVPAPARLELHRRRPARGARRRRAPRRHDPPIHGQTRTHGGDSHDTRLRRRRRRRPRSRRGHRAAAGPRRPARRRARTHPARHGHRVDARADARRASSSSPAGACCDRVVDAGTPPVRHTAFHYADETCRVTIRRSPGVDALYAPRRTLLDRVLVDAAAEAGAEVRLRGDGDRRARRRTAAWPASAGRRACRDAAARDRRGHVGADGARSTVARQVGRTDRADGSRRHRRALPATDRRPAGGRLRVGLRRGAAAGLIPTNDGLTCVFVVTTPARMRTWRSSARDARLRPPGRDGRADRRSAPVLPSPSAAARLGRPRGCVRRPWGPGWALVGDAGYYKDPIAAHGHHRRAAGRRAARRRPDRAPVGCEHRRPRPWRATRRERDALSHRFFVTIDADGQLRAGTSAPCAGCCASRARR